MKPADCFTRSGRTPYRWSRRRRSGSDWLELLDVVTMTLMTVAIVVTWAFAELMGYVFGPGRVGRWAPNEAPSA